jgi:di/tricarboxylate transporter
VIAAAVEEYRLHRRLALAILSRAGRSPYRLVLGFLSTTAFLSMWLSNTATAAMMAPLASAVMETLSKGQAQAQGQGKGNGGARPLLLAEEEEEEEEDEEEGEEEIALEMSGVGRSLSLDERGRDGVAAGGRGRVRGQTEDPGVLFGRRQQQQQVDGEREEMVEIRLWGREGEQGEGEAAMAAGEYWCGIRKSQIEFAISVSICYGASLGGMATLTGASARGGRQGGRHWVLRVDVSTGNAVHA